MTERAIYLKHRTRFMKTTNFLLFFSMILSMSPFSAIAKPHKAIDPLLISAQVEQFLKNEVMRQLPSDSKARVKIDVRNLDRYIKLSQCDRPLTLKLQGQRVQRQTSVKVICDGSSPWSLYVSSTLYLEMPVVSLRRELPRRHVLRKEDLTTTLQNVYSLRDGYTTEASLIVGQELKRALRTGDVVYSFNLQAPDIIKKGDRVTVVARRNGLSVMSHGIALSDASAGEKVRIENQRSTRIIQAKVVGPGTVEVL